MAENSTKTQNPSPSESSSEANNSPQHKIWIKTQDSLKQRLITEDDFTFELPSQEQNVQGSDDQVVLKYIGGTDISYSKKDPSIACGSLVVLDIQTLQVVYEDFSVVQLHVPYVPGFLAFREAPIILELLKKMRNVSNPFYPQMLMVDGNGLLHPRGFGLACHLGVLANIPTIGIGKNLHHVDGLTSSGVRQLLEAKQSSSEDLLALKGSSGCIWGMAMKSAEGSSKPIFISVGHRISLCTATRIVKMTCKYRVPEPVRQADIRSREYLRKHQ